MTLMSWTIFHVPSFFFTGKIVVSHVALLGINSLQERNLYIRSCTPILASFFYWISFPPGEPSGVSEGYNDGLCLVFLPRDPVVPNLGVNLIFPGFLGFPCWRDSESSLLSSEVVKPWGLRCLPWQECSSAWRIYLFPTMVWGTQELPETGGRISVHPSNIEVPGWIF